MSGLGCVTDVFCLRTGAFFFSFRGSRGATRNPAKDGFSLSLSPDLGGVWLFCIHCREVAALGVSGLGCVTFSVYVLGLVSSPLEFPEVPFRNPAKDRFLLRLSPDLGGVCLFCIHCREVAAWGLSGLGCVTFSVYVLGLFSSPLGAPKVPLRNPAKDGFFASSEPGFRCVWLFCIHCREVAALGCVRARLRYVFCLRTGACFFSFRGSRGATSQPCEGRFLLRLSPDLGGVWLFCLHCREVAALGVSGLGCVAFSEKYCIWSSFR